MLRTTYSVAPDSCPIRALILILILILALIRFLRFEVKEAPPARCGGAISLPRRRDEAAALGCARIGLVCFST